MQSNKELIYRLSNHLNVNYFILKAAHRHRETQGIIIISSLKKSKGWQRRARGGRRRSASLLDTGVSESSREIVIYKPPPATRQQQHLCGRGTNQTSNLSAGVLSTVLSGSCTLTHKHIHTGICASCLLED